MIIDGAMLIDVAELNNMPDSMDDIVGLESLKRMVGVIIKLSQNPGAASAYDNIKVPKGILLAGYPGTGKTLVGKRIAKALSRTFIYIPSAALLSPLPGVGKSRVKALFQYARDNKPCVLFLDEIDAVVKDREQSGSDNGGALQQFLTELDGHEDNEGILVLAATNVLDQLDAAFKRSGRFDVKVFFNLPSEEQRYEFFNRKLQKYGASDLDIYSFTELTCGMSYADLEAVWKESMINAFSRSGKLSNNDVLIAIQRIVVGESSNNVDLAADEKAQLICHVSGHTLGYVFKPSLFIMGQTKCGAMFSCKPKTKKFFIYDIDNIICEILSISLSREADKNNSGYGATNLYYNDKIRLDELINIFFVLLGLYDVGVKNIEDIKRKMCLEFAKAAADIFADKTYSHVFEGIVKYYKNNDMMSSDDLKNIMKECKLSSNRARKNYHQILLRVIKSSGLQSLLGKAVIDKMHKLETSENMTLNKNDDEQSMAPKADRTAKR